MHCFTLDPKALLGGVFFQDNDQELVQLALQRGNELPRYETQAIVLMVVLHGRLAVECGGEVLETQGLQVLRFAPGEAHTVRALEDETTVLVFKQLCHQATLAKRLRFGDCCL